MGNTRTSTRSCMIQNKQVSILEEELSELGRQGSMGWRIKKCLDRDKSCEKKECKYAPRGIGDTGSVDPFTS